MVFLSSVQFGSGRDLLLAKHLLHFETLGARPRWSSPYHKTDHHRNCCSATHDDIGIGFKIIIQVRSCSVMSDSAGKIFVKYLVLFNISMFFPECVARVPVSLWGSGGWGCVRSTLPNRSQPSATVRNRPQPSAWGPYGRAYSKFCKRGHFWRFQTSRCFVSRGGRGPSWHSDVFCNVSKVVLCGRRNTFTTFSQDELQFSWQAQHFGRVHRHFAWQAQHFRRVVVRAFLRIALSGLRQVATRCKFRGRRGILWDVMTIDGSLARNTDFGLQIFRF